MQYDAATALHRCASRRCNRERPIDATLARTTDAIDRNPTEERKA